MKLREHRGGLAESMATVVEIEPTLGAVVARVRQVLAPWGVKIKKREVKVAPYCFDDRIGWDTHVVTVEGYGVFGFTDGPVAD